MVKLIPPELNIDQFNRLFPFFISIRRDFTISLAGKSILKLQPGLLNKKLTEVFEVFRPVIPDLDFAKLEHFNQLLILRMINNTSILYRCQVDYIQSTDEILLTGTPWFRNMEEVMAHKLSLHDFSISDPMIDMLHLLKTEEIVTNEVKELLERIRKEKMESERIAGRMNSLFLHATEGVILTDQNGNIILINPAACKMFGFSPEELINNKIEVLIPEQFKKGHEALRSGFIKEPVNRQMGQGRDLRAQRKDGTTFPVEVSLSNYIQDDERFIIAFLIDISQRKEIEQNILSQQSQLEKITSEMRKLNSDLEAKVEERTVILKEALQKLEESQAELNSALDKERQLNEIKGRFVSMASHEFRTPLSTVLSSANLLTKYTTSEDQPKRERHIGKIRESVKHLNSLLEDFLSLGKLDEGKISAKVEAFNSREVIQDTIADMNGLLKEGQEVKFSFKGKEEALSDKMFLKNILINLISNASKFSDENKTISVDCAMDEEGLHVTVQDNGMGISEEDQTHLFSTFFRGTNAFNIQGTGLGLHIVRRYLDILKGRISLESELGRGTRINFIIPNNPNKHAKESSGN